MRATHRATFLLSVALVACSSAPTTVEQLRPELRESKIVSLHEPDARIPDTATYSWMPGSLVALGPGVDATATEATMRSLLEDGLHRRGIYLAPGGRGELWVGYSIVMESVLDDADLDATYGIRRSRKERSGVRHDRGALILDVVDRREGEPLWRGSVAVLAAPDLPEDVRIERIRRGVELLLDQFKKGY